MGEFSFFILPVACTWAIRYSYAIALIQLFWYGFKIHYREISSKRDRTFFGSLILFPNIRPGRFFLAIRYFEVWFKENLIRLIEHGFWYLVVIFWRMLVWNSLHCNVIAFCAFTLESFSSFKMRWPSRCWIQVSTTVHTDFGIIQFKQFDAVYRWLGFPDTYTKKESGKTNNDKLMFIYLYFLLFESVSDNTHCDCIYGKYSSLAINTGNHILIP